MCLRLWSALLAATLFQVLLGGGVLVYGGRFDQFTKTSDLDGGFFESKAPSYWKSIGLHLDQFTDNSGMARDVLPWHDFYQTWTPSWSSTLERIDLLMGSKAPCVPFQAVLSVGEVVEDGVYGIRHINELTSQTVESSCSTCQITWDTCVLRGACKQAACLSWQEWSLDSPLTVSDNTTYIFRLSEIQQIVDGSGNNNNNNIDNVVSPKSSSLPKYPSVGVSLATSNHGGVSSLADIPGLSRYSSQYSFRTLMGSEKSSGGNDVIVDNTNNSNDDHTNSDGGTDEGNTPVTSSDSTESSVGVVGVVLMSVVAVLIIAVLIVAVGVRNASKRRRVGILSSHHNSSSDVVQSKNNSLDFATTSAIKYVDHVHTKSERYAWTHDNDNIVPTSIMSSQRHYVVPIDYHYDILEEHSDRASPFDGDGCDGDGVGVLDLEPVQTHKTSTPSRKRKVLPLPIASTTTATKEETPKTPQHAWAVSPPSSSSSLLIHNHQNSTATMKRVSVQPRHVDDQESTSVVLEPQHVSTIGRGNVANAWA
eukprot:m.62918 g.62918  ORF g.62918 m.62918 type:complete len:535 (+) comp11421_c0_seq1:222-1826(+)